jgi:hypothetical protein
MFGKLGLAIFFPCIVQSTRNVVQDKEDLWYYKYECLHTINVLCLT